MRKKSSFTAEFKFKVALESMVGENSIAELSSKYKVSPENIRNWKNILIEKGATLFIRKQPEDDSSKEKNELKEKLKQCQQKYGEMVLEKDFAVKLLNESLSTKDRISQISSDSPLTISKQLEILDISRSTYYYKGLPNSDEEEIKKEIIAIKEEYKGEIKGCRRVRNDLQKKGFRIGKDRVLKLMNEMGIKTIYPKKKTTVANKEHQKFSYKLRDIEIDKPNKVWSGDITYIKTKKGYMYLAVIIDWHSRAVLSWKLSNTMDVHLVADVLESAIYQYGVPEIFNSDQGSQYTSSKHTSILQENNIQISMNGKGRSIDNIMVERFFRSIKYEDILVMDYESVVDLKEGIKKYMNWYNNIRGHSSFNYLTPFEIYNSQELPQVG
jgi:putative transposase